MSNSKIRIWKSPAIFFYTALILVVLLSAACGDDSRDGKGTASPNPVQVAPIAKEHVSVGYLPIIPALPVMMAEEAGTFADAGLDVELVKFATSNDAMTALIAGKVHVYFLASSSVTLLIEQNSPGATKSFMVNVNTKGRPLDQLLVATSSPIESVAQLRGKKIGVFPGTTMKGFLRAALIASGVPSESVEIVELSPPQQGVALSTGQVDALLALEPVPAQLIGAGKARSILSGLVESLVLDPWVGGTATVRSDYAASHGKVIHSFLGVVEGQLPRLRSPDDQNLAVLAKYTGISPDVARRAGFVDWLPLARIPRADVQRLADKMFEVGALARHIDTAGLFLE